MLEFDLIITGLFVFHIITFIKQQNQQKNCFHKFYRNYNIQTNNLSLNEMMMP